MPPKTINRLCMLILLVVIAILVSTAGMAVTSSYETASVSRVVGDTAADMEAQLTSDRLNLNHVTYFADDHWWDNTEEKSEILENEFPRRYNIREGGWNWERVDNTLGQFQRNEYFIIETDGEVDGNNILSDERMAGDLDWEDAFNENKPLFIFDSDYAGLYLPGISSFVGELSKDAVMVAPTSTTSRELVRSFVCNLRENRNIGEAFRQARNNYYWHVTDVRNFLANDEFVGLTMLSYMMYGNPLRGVSLPEPPDNDLLEENCDNYLEEFEQRGDGRLINRRDGNRDEQPDGAYLLSSRRRVQEQRIGPMRDDGENTYEEEFTLVIDEHEIVETGDYSILEIEGMHQWREPYELILPRALHMNEYPMKTVVTGVSLIELEDPVEITIENLPEWRGEPADRTCLYEQRDASVDFTQAFTEDSQLIITSINPVEVVNCEEGELILYRSITYQMTYIPHSPVLIESLQYNPEVTPGERVNVDVTLSNTGVDAVEGVLQIRDEDDELRAEQGIELEDSDTFSMQFMAPEFEGVRRYKVEFLQDDEPKTYKEFSIATNLLEAELVVPEIVGEEADVELLITNLVDVPVEVFITYYLINDDEEIVSDELEEELEAGINTFNLHFSDLSREDQSYEILVYIDTGEHTEILSAQLVTNHYPFLYHIAPVYVNEDDSVEVTPEYYDIDEDDLEVSYSGDFESNVIEPGFDDAGEYTLTVTVSDGLLETSQDVSIVVLNVNRLPVLSDIPDQETDEDTPIELDLDEYSEDPDREDELTYTATETNLEEVLCEVNENILTIAPAQDWNGETECTITADDGNDGIAEGTIAITVNPVNDAPVFEEVPDQILPEDSGRNDNLFNLFDYASDVDTPDEELRFEMVSQSNEDVVICFYRLNNHAFGCSTQENQFGTSDITISVYDPEFTVEQTFTVIVESVNDAPVCEIDEPIILEDGNELVLDLDRYCSDVDDELTYAVLEFSPEDVVEVEQPERNMLRISFPEDWNGIASVTIQASDEELESEPLEITIEVGDVNHPCRWVNVPERVVLTMNCDGYEMFPDLREIADDPDGDDLEFSVDENEHLELEISDDFALLATCEGDWMGDTEVVMTCSDGEFGVEANIRTLVLQEHIIDLNIGWNLISSYLIPHNPDIRDIFEPLGENLILVKDGDGRFFVPAYDFNNIPGWVSEEAYYVKVNRRATFEIQGREYTNPRIEVAAGWNARAYPLPEAMAMEEIIERVLAPLVEEDNLIIIKNGRGNFYIPEWNFNNIREIGPGEGYLMKVREADVLNFANEDRLNRAPLLEDLRDEMPEDFEISEELSDIFDFDIDIDVMDGILPDEILDDIESELFSEIDTKNKGELEKIEESKGQDSSDDEDSDDVQVPAELPSEETTISTTTSTITTTLPTTTLTTTTTTLLPGKKLLPEKPKSGFYFPLRT